MKKSIKKIVLLSILALFLLISLLLFNFSKFLPSNAQEKTSPQHVDWQDTQIDQIIVYKKKRELQVLTQGQIIKTYKIRLGFNPNGHKTTEGDGKTPEGHYILDWRNPNSQFYKSLHVSYPNAQDQTQASARGVSAGGDIMIHGSAKKWGGSQGEPLYNYLPKKDWTWGCIAVSNQDMDELWDNVKNGTTIEIYP